MSQTLRHPEILETVRRQGTVTVEGLAAQLGVTLQTIRRDLSDLAEAGKLERVHGGAILPSGTTNILYEDRRTLNAEAKARIGRACAADIPDGTSLFLGIGTTTEAVARTLLHHRAILVVTNNLNIAGILGPNRDCEIVMTGGTLRRSDAGLIGEMASETLARFKFDIAVIGCSTLDADGDILDFDIGEVGVSRTIVAQARRTFLVADRTKFERKAPARVASLSAIDTVFTDHPFPGDLAARCGDWHTRVVVAGADA